MDDVMLDRDWMTSGRNAQSEAWFWWDEADAGLGSLRVDGVGQKRLSAGFAPGDHLVLLPGQWHRYYSTDAVGWHAIWYFISAPPSGR